VSSTKQLTVPDWILYPPSRSRNLLGHSVQGLAVVDITVGMLLLWHSSGTFCVMWRKRYYAKIVTFRRLVLFVSRSEKIKTYSDGMLRQSLSSSDGATCTWRRRKNQIPKHSGTRALCCHQTIGEVQNWSAIVSVISSHVCLLVDWQSLRRFGCLMTLICHVWSSNARFWVLTAVLMKIQILRDVMPCWFLNSHWNFGEMGLVALQGITAQEA
jgi:hypothetical protein